MDAPELAFVDRVSVFDWLDTDDADRVPKFILLVLIENVIVGFIVAVKLTCDDDIIATAIEALSPPESDIDIIYCVVVDDAVDGLVAVIPDIVTVVPAAMAVEPLVIVTTFPDTKNVAPDIDDVAEPTDTEVNPEGNVIVTVPDAGIPETASNEKLFITDVADTVWLDIVSDIGVSVAAFTFDINGFIYINNNDNIIVILKVLVFIILIIIIKHFIHIFVNIYIYIYIKGFFILNMLTKIWIRV